MSKIGKVRVTSKLSNFKGSARKTTKKMCATTNCNKNSKKKAMEQEQDNSVLGKCFRFLGKYMGHIVCSVTGAFLIALLTIMILLIATGCTYSINMIHSSGTASHVVEESEYVDPTVDPNLNIP